MCRICGRFVKCIFDNMPSRTLSSGSRRTLATLRTPCTSISPSTPRTFLTSTRPPRTPPSSSIASLSRFLTTLRLSPSTSSSPLTALHQPTTPTPTLSTPLPSSHRAFSTTSPLLGKRRRMDTYSPSRKVQKRRHGYLARLKTKSGRAIMKRRIERGKAPSW